VARVLDVAEQLVDDDIHTDLVERDTVDGIGQQLSEPDRPAREVPQTVTRTAGPTGQQYTEIGAHNKLHGEPRYFPEDLLILGLG